MNDFARNTSKLPPEQEAIRSKCFHPCGRFIEFPEKDLRASIPERFEAIVGLHRNRLAVKTPSESVTYDQLNGKANQVARVLVGQRRARPELIAVLLEKDVSQLAVMLGIMKAGKFFLILDPTFPKARIAAMLKDSRARLVVTNRRHESLAKEVMTSACQLMAWESFDRETSSDDLGLRISPKALAFINYTSGSTGEPKGLLRTHRMILHNIMLRTNLVHVCAQDRISLLSSGTSNAITNTFLALLNGAGLFSLELKKEGVTRLAGWLSEEKITIAPMSSPLFRSLCETLSAKNNFPDLRVIRLRSEAVYKEDARLYKTYFSSGCVFVTGLSSNETGPLRDFLIDHQSEVSGSAVPVGYAVPGKEIIVLDDSGKELGLGEVGEIVVRSRYLSPGYLRRPQLTRAKFKSDPKGEGRRLYLTGDLGVMSADGCLIYKGRKDFRVKIRGYGVDLKEVELALRNHPAVTDAVVVVRENDRRENELTGYFTSTMRTSPTESELRSFLGQTLADYMIPSALVMLDSIPLTPHNKVDRNALPPPGHLRSPLDTPSSEPLTELERGLANIWAEVLCHNRFGKHDNFFDLGGHSLAATRIVSRVIETYGVQIPVRALFDSPTIAKMATIITEHPKTENACAPSDRAAISRNEVRPTNEFIDFEREAIEQSSPQFPGRVAVKTRSPEEKTLAKVSTEVLGIEKTHPASGGKEKSPTRSALRSEPLSFAQQRLWFVDQLQAGGSTYNLFSAYQIKGGLKVNAVEQSFNEIIKRHEVLRTVFDSVDGQPVQKVLPSLTITIPVLDLRGAALEKEQQSKVRRLAREEAERPFDLARGPLLRITLLRLADDEYLLLRAMHHIVSDAWSGGVLFRELATLYEAFASGQSSPLADLPIQYADYAARQRQWLRGEILQSQLSYWKQQLENIPTLRLPIDRPRPAVQTSSGARQRFTLSDTLSSELKSLSRRHGVTVFMTLVAAFQTLLSRYSGQTDIVIGSPVAGRNRSEFESLIGFFLNMLVLRTDLSGDPTFAEALNRVRDTCLGALNHQELPFEKLVEELHPERDLSQNPLFQVTFAFQNAPRFAAQLSGTTVKEVEFETCIARFDLHCFMEEEDGRLKGAINYNADLFNADTIERLIGHFETLLGGAVANPNQRISELPILTEAETRRLLVEWNDTKRDYPKDSRIHELFEAQVEKSPDAVAVVFEKQQLTYRELNSRANQLAHYLQSLRVETETTVGICVNRSLEMVVGILGILKAGGAYVPLDAGYPKERLSFMLDDTRCAVLLTQEHLLNRLPVQNAPLVCLDRDWPAIARQKDSNLDAECSAENLAYVVYTSGSTGKPKGVAVSHRAVNRLVMNTDYAALSPADVVAQASSVSFDAATFEIWGALLNGAQLVLIPTDSVLSPPAMSKAIERHGVTTLFLTTGLFNLAVEQIPSALGKLQNLLFGGEAADPQRVRQLLAETPPKRLLHVYGPTESTTFASWYRVRSVADNAITVPVGRPIANTEIYILDSCLNPLPIGATGELYIGGDGLARGYLNQPELTDEKFIPNSFGEKSGSRLYRTGDLARHLIDGNIEFLGRIDDQVKIRGYRIEPREVNVRLSAHPGIKTSHVIARPDKSGELALTAYYVEAQTVGPPPTAAELRNFLAAQLPHYMIPVCFVPLAQIPLTPNGKIDHTALLDSQRQETQNDHSYTAPRNETETVLCQLWGELLKRDCVGIDDDFFAIGGHSLLAAKLFSCLDERFGRSLPLSVLFAAPTVRALAERYSTPVERKFRALIALRETGSLPPIFAVPGVYGNIVCFAELNRELGPDQPFYGLQSVGLDGAEPPLRSIEAMAELYISEIRAVHPCGPYVLSGACFGATVAYEMTRQLLAAGEEVSFVGLLDPTRREANDRRGYQLFNARALGRATALKHLVSTRWHLYLQEIRQAEGKERTEFLARKLRSLAGLVREPNRVKAVQRELNQIEVYRANVAALDRYERKPLNGKLRAVEIFHTARHSSSEWKILWSGSTVRHLLPGRDSGDLLTGGNVKTLAPLLAERLSRSLERKTAE